MLHPFAPREMPFGRPVGRAGLGRIPVTVVTGFLGAGKTTLIRELLKTPEAANSALIVNEFGEIGIDDALLRTSTENTVLLGNGCVCCAVSSDLHLTLRQLFADRERGAVPDFGRVIIETSGLADPTPVLQTLATDRALGTRFALSGLVTVVDAVLALANSQLFEWRKQVALADRLVVTKTDAASLEMRSELGRVLDKLAPRAARAVAASGRIDPLFLLAGAVDPDVAAKDVPGAGREHDRHHADAYVTFSVTREEPIEWPVMQQSLDVLAALCGAQLLRLKGLVSVRGRPGPVVVHRVQHIAHAPEELTAWPEGVSETRLVLIGRGLDEARVRALLSAVWAFDDRGEMSQGGQVGNDELAAVRYG